MRRILQNLIIAFTVIFLFMGMVLYNKSEYVEASGQYTSNITIRNTSPLELENVQVKFNGAETVTIGAMQSGEKRENSLDISVEELLMEQKLRFIWKKI